MLVLLLLLLVVVVAPVQSCSPGLIVASAPGSICR
jgi:hypothetical protein